MRLFKKKQQTSQRMERIKRQYKATTQRTIKFESLGKDGHMVIGNNRYSHTYKLGDTTYTMAKAEDKINIIDKYADVLNGLENHANFQLLLINRRLTKDHVVSVYYPLQNDNYDKYRREYNQLIQQRFEDNAKAFELSKYITITLSGLDTQHAKRKCHDVSTRLIDQFNKINIPIKHLHGQERLAIFSELLRGTTEFPFDYDDIENSGIGEKSFIAPNNIRIQKNHLEIDDVYAKVKYIRHFPKQLSDKLIYEFSQLGFEFALVINAEVCDMADVNEQIENVETDAGINIIRASKDAMRNGVLLPEEFIGSGKDKDALDTANKWRVEIKEYDQKVFKGWIAVYLKADSLTQLEEYEREIDVISNTLGCRFENIDYYQEEALNSILPIGECFVDVRQKLSRHMTTANIATQVPFTQNDLISASPKALYYGQNQLSNNMITLDRKRDLLTGSGIICGISGSGKSFAVKLNEIIPTILRYSEDRIIIVDPEDEYSDIGYTFNAQHVDISIGSSTHINLLDLPNVDLLDAEEAKDPIGEKADFLTVLFDAVLKEPISDNEATLIDRVTKETYQRYEFPTMREWHNVLLEQPGITAQELAERLEIYTIGSQSLFSHETNVNLTNQVVIFNLKHLKGKLKPLALLVIQDFIWNQVVNNKGKLTTRPYFDELQLYLRTPQQAKFFTELYSRVRKYGAFPTGITQNIETIAAIEEGRKLLSNSEFMMILKQKNTDIAVLKEIITLTDEQIKYISQPKHVGTGLIYAGGMIVPFENPIPKDFELYKIIETDA